MRTIDFRFLTEEVILDLISQAPFYGMERKSHFKEIVSRGIGLVHAIPQKLFTEDSRGKLVVYFGRAGATAMHVKNRFLARGHRFGTILAVVPTKCVRKVEGDAIRFFSILSRSDYPICIKRIDNLADGGNGPLPDTEYSVIYLTWKFESEAEIGKIPPSVIPEMADAIFHELVQDISRAHLRMMLGLTRRFSYVVPLRWYPGHEV